MIVQGKTNYNCSLTFECSRHPKKSLNESFLGARYHGSAKEALFPLEKFCYSFKFGAFKKSDDKQKINRKGSDEQQNGVKQNEVTK